MKEESDVDPFYEDSDSNCSDLSDEKGGQSEMLFVPD